VQVTPDCPYSEKEYDFAYRRYQEKLFERVLLGIYKDGQLHKNPIEPLVISENDYLVILASGDGASALKRDFGVEEGRFK